MWGFCVQSLFCGVVLSLLHLAEEESRWLLGIIVFLLSHARIQNFLPEGAQLWQLFFFFFFFFFLVDEMREDPNTTICGPTLSHRWNAFRLRADDGPTLNFGLVALCFSENPDKYCHETLYMCGFSEGGGVRTPYPPLETPMLSWGVVLVCRMWLWHFKAILTCYWSYK